MAYPDQAYYSALDQVTGAPPACPAGAGKADICFCIALG